MKALLFILMASIGQGSAAPSIETVPMKDLNECRSVATQLKDTPKPGKGYTQYSYLCVEVSQ
ncbi:hypothetical protein NAHI_16 [Klebsiella phage vB_KpnP_NahiliMali]|uniref:Uncharacterized protein n=1 Tax=Klebsiella phage vB_KpnP_NahiliMali TaxID=2591373 RepID=A0A5B9NPA2_9CAUD|nr:hypothetical protein NAHI_16 [Klebsiella phage vB_KpnP_NahiliMali]